MQTRIYGADERGGLHQMGKHEAYDWPKESRTGWIVGGHQRACVITSGSLPPSLAARH